MRMRATIDTAREARARLIRHPPDRDPVNLRTGHTTGRGGAFSHCAQLVLTRRSPYYLLIGNSKPLTSRWCAVYSASLLLFLRRLLLRVWLRRLRSSLGLRHLCRNQAGSTLGQLALWRLL